MSVPSELHGDARVIRNLAMLIYRLVRQVRKYDRNNPVVDSALGYLQRQDILLDPLRGQADTGELPGEASDGR